MTQLQAVIERIELLGGVATLNQIAIQQMTVLENVENKKILTK